MHAWIGPASLYPQTLGAHTKQCKGWGGSIKVRRGLLHRLSRPRVQPTPTPAAPLWTQTSPWRRTGRVPGEKWRARLSSSWREPRYTCWLGARLGANLCRISGPQGHVRVWKSVCGGQEASHLGPLPAFPQEMFWSLSLPW